MARFEDKTLYFPGIKSAVGAGWGEDPDAKNGQGSFLNFHFMLRKEILDS